MDDADIMDAGLVAAMRYSTEPMALADPHRTDMPIVAVNTAFETLTGYPSAEIIGQNCRFLQGARTDRETVGRMGACLRQGQGCIQWLLNYRKDGSVFWNLLFISPVYAGDGRLLYFFANQHDLSAEQPIGLDQFVLGPAHMALPQQMVFHDVVRELGVQMQGARPVTPNQTQALESVLAAARQVAFLSTRLQAGPSPGA